MITYVNNGNIGQYRILYEKATRDLMAHNSTNELVEPSQLLEDINDPRNPLIMPTALTAEEAKPKSEGGKYVAGEFYRWDEVNKKYIVAEESTPEPDKTYYEAERNIGSLNEYFGYIKNLAEINPLYTALPLDEDVFSVNLNTRKIEIPAHFKENGVSVQGDEIAEVLYFKVNRYFDAQDLAYELATNKTDRMRIFIQWRSAQAGEDGKLIEGVSVPWVVDLTTYPDYILFGWPISSKITGKEGKIDFAVRFFKFQDKQVTYSLSSLTHTVDVKPSLDFDITTRLIDVLEGTAESDLVLDDSTQLILNRLANSEVSSEGVEAGKPYFFMVSNEGPDGILLTTGVDKTVGTNLPGAEGEEGNGIITFVDSNNNTHQIQTSEGLVPEFWLARNTETGILDVETEFKVAGSGDGRISYDWRKIPLDYQGNYLPLEVVQEMRPTSDTEAQIGKTYYQDLGGGGWNRVVSPIFDQTDENYVPLYERFSIAKIDGVGHYIVTITNRVQTSNARKESIEMTVNAPLEAQNNVPVVDSDFLKAANDWNLTLTTDAEPRDRSVLTYQWYYAPTPEGGYEAAEPITGATESSYTIEGSQSDYDVDGYYYVIITSNMNGEQAMIHGNENGTRITHEATKPLIIYQQQKDKWTLSEIQAENGIKVQGEYTNEHEVHIPGEELSIKWYRYGVSGDHNRDADAAAAENGNYVLDENDVEIEEARGLWTFTPQLGGHDYYCAITNTYNGSTATSYSKFFNITND